MEEREEAILDLNKQWGLQLPLRLTAEELEARLAERLNALIRDDFPALVQLLYQQDVSEQKLRLLLQTQPGEDAGLIMARLVIHRVLQKIATRRAYRSKPPNDDCSEERW